MASIDEVAASAFDRFNDESYESPRARDEVEWLWRHLALDPELQLLEPDQVEDFLRGRIALEGLNGFINRRLIADRARRAVHA